jgi:hypothetical protein
MYADPATFRFMYEASGWSHYLYEHPVNGRMRSAWQSARAEHRLLAAKAADQARVLIEEDDFPDVSWMDDQMRAEYERGEIAMLQMALQTRCSCCGSWTTAASLGGISIEAGDPDSYLRVVEAELASEAGF